MDFFRLLPITFILICVAMITISYDNLLENNDAVIFINGNKAPIGAKDTIDGNTSTCLDIGGFYKGDGDSSWYVNFRDVQSLFEIIVYLGCRNGTFGTNCSRNCPDNCVEKKCDILEVKCLSGLSSDGLQRKDLQQNQENQYALKTKEDKTTEYALWVLITIITIVNFVLLVMYIRRFLKTRKNESHGNQSPVYLNISNENKKYNRPPDGEQLDKSNVTYEVLGVPSSETHYDALQ